MTPLKTRVTRVTVQEYRGRYSDCRGRRIVCSLLPGDMLMLRPYRTSRPEYIRLSDVYDLALRSRVLSERAQAINHKRRNRK